MRALRPLRYMRTSRGHVSQPSVFAQVWVSACCCAVPPAMADSPPRGVSDSVPVSVYGENDGSTDAASVFRRAAQPDVPTFITTMGSEAVSGLRMTPSLAELDRDARTQLGVVDVSVDLRAGPDALSGALATAAAAVQQPATAPPPQPPPLPASASAARGLQ